MLALAAQGVMVAWLASVVQLAMAKAALSASASRRLEVEPVSLRLVSLARAPGCLCLFAAAWERAVAALVLAEISPAFLLSVACQAFWLPEAG
jgi:hypothetical protein